MMKTKKSGSRHKEKRTELPVTYSAKDDDDAEYLLSLATSAKKTHKGKKTVFGSVPRRKQVQKAKLLALLTLLAIVLCVLSFSILSSRASELPVHSARRRSHNESGREKAAKSGDTAGYDERANEGADGERILEYAGRGPKWYLNEVLKARGETIEQVTDSAADPFRVLFNCDIYTYTHSTNRIFFTLFEALKEIEGVEPYLWGPGFPNYNDDMNLAQNIAKQWGKPNYFDFVFNNTLRLEPTRKWLGPGEGVGPIAVLYQDCFHKEKLPSPNYKYIFPCEHKGSDLYFHTYANQMGYYAYAGHGNLVWHLPHFVSSALYHRDVPHSARPVDILIVGSMWSVYPLRVRFLRLFDENRLPGVVRRLVARNAWLSNTTDATPVEQFLEGHRHNSEEYVRALQSAKIVLVCSSKRNIAVRTYIEAAAAGALVIGDIPGEREDEFRSWVVEVSQKQEDDAIIHTIKWWLSHNSEREARAKKGQNLVFSKYTQYNAGYEVVEAMQSYINGQRGLVFPHRFSQIDHFLPRTIPCARSLKLIEKKSY